MRNVIIWGNHSSTQYPDAAHATVDLPQGRKSAPEVVNDDKWLNEEFLQKIQKRGAAVIEARKMSSAMSAAKAAGDHMRDWWFGTQPDQWVSMGVVSDGSYGIPKDIVFSFPVAIKNKQYTIVKVIIIEIDSDISKLKSIFICSFQRFMKSLFLTPVILLVRMSLKILLSPFPFG